MLAEDQQLVARCLAGEELAQRQFLDRFGDVVYGICYRLLRDRHEAEDVAQESFLRALRSLASWDGQRPLQTWLITIAVNRCRTHLGRRQRCPVPWEQAVEVADQKADRVAEWLDARELSEVIQAGLEQLRPDYRQVFLMFHQDGLSYEQMSQRTNRPIGTLKTWLHRARLELLEFLRQKGLVPEDWHASEV